MKIFFFILILLVFLSFSLYGQMDMLPQIFRDLPPELQEGLPQEMTYDEFQILNRNVDFFTMFMSLFLPGYGFYQVKRPELAAAVLTERTAGYALMATAFFRQYDDLRDLGKISEITEEQYKNLMINIVLFSSGVILNGFGWAIDVLGAYHIAKNEKDFVIYKYGIKKDLPGIRNSEEKSISYIRKLVLQNGSYVKKDLLYSLSNHIKEFPEGLYRGEAEFYLGSYWGRAGEDARALMHFYRQYIFYPDERFTPASRREALRLIQKNRKSWEKDWNRLYAVFTMNPESFAAYLEEFRKFETPVFKELFVEEAYRFISLFPEDKSADDVLYAAALHLEDMELFEESVIALTQLAGVYPESMYCPEALLRIGSLLETKLKSEDYSIQFYQRLIENYPESPEAQEAEKQLSKAAGEN